MAFHIYILKSTNNRHYIGYTSNLDQRIYKHNNKHNGFTNTISEKWELLISLELSSKKEAMAIEKRLKAFKNYVLAINFLERLQQDNSRVEHSDF